VIVAPEVRYAPSGELSIAYQVVGDAPVDLVIVPGVLDHLDTRWEEAGLIRFVERLARFARVVMLDRRGIGLSDRLPADAVSTPAESAADVRAVLDAASSERAVVLGLADAGFAAVTFAATYPERTRALVLYSALASGGPRPGYPWGVDDALVTEWTALIEREWGTGVFAVIFGDPSPEVRHAFARMERRACTPRAAVAQIRASLASDVRHLLPMLRVPTLVVQHRDHPFIPVEAARWVVGQIPGARYVEHTFPFSALDEVTGHPGLAEAIEEFVTGGPAADAEGGVLAALLFTDIVDSTAHAARLGDRRWHDVLDEHDRRVRATVARGGGRVVKTTGDGVLAQFDGARRAVRCAQAIVEESRRIGLAVRAGVHAGDCERRGDDVAGMTVHVAARVAALAGAGEVLVTAAVRDAVVGTDLAFAERGRHALRGVPGEWALLAARRARRGESAG
jgi:class 3 adenylate cyclase/pimeloyl-ACP methyl ester carboxylesterase